MQTIHYPVKGRTMQETFTQEMLNRLTAQLELWMQGPGVVGALQLHACWGKTSVLGKRYQGQTVSQYRDWIEGAMALYDATGNPKWRRMAGEFVANVLFLQEPDGGFRHASAEFEPTYLTKQSCPIHQCSPLLALMDYDGWQHADGDLKAMIRPAIDRHWAWFHDFFWKIGNGGHRPLPHPGWCGVTNQDLVVVAALSAYGRRYGDWSRFEQFGKPALEAYLAPDHYYEAMGLFERGDGVNFAERTSYYTIIVDMLHRIAADTGDDRLIAIADNVCRHWFDAAYTAPDGLTHLAWGAKTDGTDKSRVTGWVQTPVTFAAYPKIIQFLEDYLTRHPNAEHRAIWEQLQETLCAYIYADGLRPLALWPADPILSIVSSPDREGLWTFLIRYLDEAVQNPQPVSLPCIHRVKGNCTWKQKGKLWAIEKEGERVYGGYTPLAYGVTHGPEEAPAVGDFAELEACDVLEILPD